MVGLEIFAVEVSERMMDSARDAAAVSDAVISPSLLATSREPPRRVALPVNLALVKCSRVLLPRALSLPTKRIGVSVAIPQRTGARFDKLRGCHSLWHDRRFAAEGVGAFIGGACATGYTTQETLVEASQLLQGLKPESLSSRLWFLGMCHLVIFGF